MKSNKMNSYIQVLGYNLNDFNFESSNKLSLSKKKYNVMMS